MAAAGYGKSTALRRWFPRPDTHWHRVGGAPQAGAVSQLVREAVRAGATVIVLDDVPRLSRDTVQDLVAAVESMPTAVTVVLSSRWPQHLPAADSLGHGLWGRRGPADLALSAEQVADVLRKEYDRVDPDLADRVHEATAGWPALVHLAADMVRADGAPHGSLVTALSEPGGPLATYVAGEVLAALPPAAVRLIRQVGHLAPVTAGVCRALGHRGAEEAVRLLSRVGVIARAGPPVPGLPPVHRIVPVVAEVCGHGRRCSPAQRTAHAALAAAWYREHGPPVAAARAYRLAGDEDACAGVLEAHGAAIVAGGDAAAVAELTAGLPPRLHTRAVRLVRGDALRTVGEVDAAARAYAAVADAEPHWDAGLAWRVGRIAYQRGDARAALAAFARAEGPEASTADAALLLAWTAHAHLLAGEVDRAAGCAGRAIEVAVAADDDPARATAHLSMALCLSVTGDEAGSAEQYGLASSIAERTGDIVLLSRIFTNRAYRLLRTARYADALAVARRSGRYAAAAGYLSLAALAVNNEAEALTMLGRFDEAVQRYEWALVRFHRMGSRRLCWARLGLAEVYRRRGWRERARAAYEEAVRAAREAANAHVLTEALAGLALVVLDDDPRAAAGHADRAADGAAAELRVPALLAQGWVAHRTGDLAGAAHLVQEAARIAREHGDLARMADALELRAATETDPARVRAELREAHAIWVEAGATVEAARILVLLGRRPEACADDRLDGVVAAGHLAAAGAVTDRPGDTALTGSGGPAPGGEVAIQALGRFEVRLGGVAVSASQWQSRKARELLKILVARRGRPVPRGELCELLWPDDDPERTGHRLSVLLSIVRGVLDPAKAVAADHYLAADQASVALDLSRLQVDVVDFLAHVAHGRRLAEAGAWAEARTVLAAADARYRAEAFEDEPYAHWCGPFREETRAAHLGMLRILAQATQATSGPDAAVGYLLRLLEHDPFDESGHRALVHALVAAGRHGEARRAFERYAAAMRAIDVRPPDEVILRPARAAAAPAARR
ncbi:hypothetical protein GCM10010166_61380 [Couchioplanes caeruleus subsp. azureus]|nr:hypothetical protein GCM10010166_61380 [Couchioplanes caeruleus subsp. azureus]